MSPTAMYSGKKNTCSQTNWRKGHFCLCHWRKETIHVDALAGGYVVLIAPCVSLSCSMTPTLLPQSSDHYRRVTNKIGTTSILI
jgi:hypothetical protein